MRSQKGWVLLAALLTAILTAAPSVRALGVEDFESYANSAALAAQWQDTAGAPVQEIDTAVVHGGSQSMKLQYNCSSDPYLNQLTYNFSSAQDWSGYSQLSIWVRSVEGSTSSENLAFQLKDTFGGTLGTAIRNTQIGDTWTEWSIDLGGFTGLNSVGQMSFTVSAFDVVNGYGSGTLYVDDLSVTAPIPEPGSLSLLLLGGLGLVLFAGKRK